MNPENLASKFAAVLAQIVPEGLGVREREGMVMIDSSSAPHAADVAEIVDEPGDTLEQVRKAATEVLSVVQDFVAAELNVPWPSREGASPAPRVIVTASEIRMWFEDAHGETVLEVPSVRW